MGKLVPSALAFRHLRSAQPNPAAAQLPESIVKSLPPLLLGFLTKYPPTQLQQPDTTAPTSTEASSASDTPKPVPAIHDTTTHSEIYPNPFQPLKDYTTGRWQGAEYGLLKQAKLCKLAREHGIEHWLPYSIKKDGAKEARLMERMALRKADKAVKGKFWERKMKEKLEQRKQAMLAMPQMMETWRERGKGKGWKKWPK